MTFDHIKLIEIIETLSLEDLDKTDFGIIGFNKDSIIEVYNNMESALSGIKKESVVGNHLFEDVAPCMNNYLVALKFEEMEELDEIIPYILSLKVKPVKVDLRLIKNVCLRLNYVLIKR